MDALDLEGRIDFLRGVCQDQDQNREGTHPDNSSRSRGSDLNRPKSDGLLA